MVGLALGWGRQGHAVAVLVGDDKAELVLWARYLGRRFEKAAGPERAEIATLVRDLEERLADPKAREKRKKLEHKVEIGKLLKGRIRLTRGELDGGQAKARAESARLAYQRF